jgi:MinD-like ATPase involved in chromosome partitioning or flagellar assembly
MTATPRKDAAEAPQTISEAVAAEAEAEVDAVIDLEVVQAPEIANIDLPAAPLVPSIPESTSVSDETEPATITGSTGLTEVVATGEVVVSEPISVAEVVSLPDETEVEDGQLSRRARLAGETSSVPESVNMLTAERVLDSRKRRDAPTMGWNGFVYKASFGRINLGDSPEERHRKNIDLLIQRRLTGGTRFVPVLTRKGGVGKTSVTTMLGMALANSRDDRVIAIDANPDRGTLAERFIRTTDLTVRDLVVKAPSVTSFSEFSTYVSRDKTRLDVLASDTDPFLSEAFGENDYNVVADIVSRYYSVALTDCGTGIVHSVMRATLLRADALVIVSGGSFDEARLAAETLTWLESNGYTELVRNSVVAINTATQGTNLVKINEIEAHFQSRVRDTVRIPYDPLLAAGSIIDFDKLKPATRDAARSLAALVVEGLPE